MKVQELLNNMQQDGFNLENALEIKKYLPIETKKAIAQAIIYECSEDEDGVQKIDSFKKYLAYMRYMIVSHTNLEYVDDDYDTLCAVEYDGVRLFDLIMRCFREDARECANILGLIIEDYKREMSLEFSIAKFLNGLNAMLASVADQIGNIDLKSMLPNDFDMDKLSSFLTNYIK